MENYYEILGVEKNATNEDLKKSFRKLSKLYHPDTTTDENKKKELEDKFKKISVAYDVLSDSDKRAAFDRPTEAQFHFGGGGNPFSNNQFGGGLADILNNLHGFKFHMGGMPGGFANFTNTQIISHYIRIDLIKALEGGEIETHIPQLNKTIKFNLPKDVPIGAEYKVKIAGDAHNQLILQLNVDIDLPKGLSDEKISQLKNIIYPTVEPEPTPSTN